MRFPVFRASGHDARLRRASARRVAPSAFVGNARAAVRRRPARVVTPISWRAGSIGPGLLYSSFGPMEGTTPTRHRPAYRCATTTLGFLRSSRQYHPDQAVVLVESMRLFMRVRCARAVVRSLRRGGGHRALRSKCERTSVGAGVGVSWARALFRSPTRRIHGPLSFDRRSLSRAGLDPKPGSPDRNPRRERPRLDVRS